jgi:DNA-binding MarR family transcriptional regulator
MTSRARTQTVDLDDLPGHHIRRLHQIAVAISLQETEPQGVAPIEFAALPALADAPGMDQRGLARSIGLDSSTTGDVVDRLESRRLVVRHCLPDDRRVRLLTLTDAGYALLRGIVPAMPPAQRCVPDGRCAIGQCGRSLRLS